MDLQSYDQARSSLLRYGHPSASLSTSHCVFSHEHDVSLHAVNVQRDGKPGGFDWDNLWSRGRSPGQQPQPSQSRAQKPAKQAEEPFYGFGDFFRDVGADWEATRRKRAAKGTPTGSLWQELADLGEDFVEFLERELSKSSDPELRRQAQESAQASSSSASADSAQSSTASSSTADRSVDIAFGSTPCSEKKGREGGGGGAVSASIQVLIPSF